MRALLRLWEGRRMNVHDVIDRADSGDVWTALGGAPLRHRRGKAFWRDGDSPNVSIDANRNVWFDHRDGVGGGVLDLIQVVLDCDRKGAVQWLASHQGVELDDNPMTPSEQREYAERRRWAEVEAEKLTQWHEDYLAGLRSKRNALWDRGREATALGYRLMTEGAHDSHLWAVVWRHCVDDLKGDQIDAEIERVRAMTPHQVIALRESLTGEKVAA